MKDVMSGKRNGIKQENVKVITVPYFKGLKLEAMFDFSRLFAVLVNTFPQEERERDRLPNDQPPPAHHRIIRADRHEQGICSSGAGVSGGSLDCRRV